MFGLCSGQPLILLGSTGPVYVFEKILYQLCSDQGWDYLSLRLWIGLWVAAILILLVAIDASAYVCYITRYSESRITLDKEILYKISLLYNWRFQFWYFWISGLQKNCLQHWLHLFSSLMPSKILSISVRITNLHHQRWLLLDAIVFKTTQSLPKIRMGGYGIILQIKMNAWDRVVHWWVVIK